MIRILLTCLFMLVSASAMSQEITARFVKADDTFFKKPDPLAAQWNKVAATTISLFPQNITTPSVYQTSVASLDVRALHNGDSMALLLVWEDPTQNMNVSLDHFSDACAIQFPIHKAEATSPFMGNKNAPVAITHWKAIWQRDVDTRYQQVTDLYPNTWTDSDRFGKSVAIDAKNPVSQIRRASPVEELIAEGFGTLTTQQHQDARGKGIWKDGKWFVVLTRLLKSKDKQDPALDIGKRTSIAFALWEGGHKDVGARKNYAMWTPFVLEKK